MNPNTLYRINNDRDHSDLLVYLIKASKHNDQWLVGILRAGVNSIHFNSDSAYVNSCHLVKATEADFKHFRIVYPQGYNN